MRTTVTVDDTLYDRAKKIVGTSKSSEVFKESLQVLIRQDSAKRLIALGGTMPEFEAPPRRR